MSLSRNPSSRRNLDVAARSYNRFACSFGLSATLPVGEFELCAWIAHLADSSPPLRYTTIRTYLSNLAAAHKDAGLEDPVAASDRVWRVWKGIKRTQGQNSARPRLPILPRTLGLLFASLNMAEFNDRVFWALACTATYGLFRLGELTVTSRESMPLTIRNLSWFWSKAGLGFSIRLDQSKTDPWRRGVDVRIVHPVAVSAMVAYLSSRPGATAVDPLFSWADNRSVSRSTFIPVLRKSLRLAGIDDTHYSGHSFRKGGASALAEAGAPDSVIQALGRWRSDAYKVYITTSEDAFLGWAQSI